MILRFVNKDDIIEKARNLKFFNKKLEEIDTVENYLKETGGGLLKWIKAEDDYGFEASIIEKIKMVKSVVDKFGDDAINEYERLTKKPDTTHPLYDKFRIIRDIMPEIDECFIPMKKEEFEIYVQVYQDVFKN